MKIKFKINAEIFATSNKIMSQIYCKKHFMYKCDSS